MGPSPVPIMGEQTDLGIRTWISEACKNQVGPKHFSDLQIAVTAAFPKAQDLKEWAWPEFTVEADHYGQLIGCSPKYDQWPSTFQETQWQNARAGPSFDRKHFPDAGPLGFPFVVHPQAVLTENQPQLAPVRSFEPNPSPETFSSLPEVEIPVTQDDPKNTEVPHYNSDTTPKTPIEPPSAEP